MPRTQAHTVLGPRGPFDVGPFAGLVLVAFAYRAMLIHFFPTVYAWDAFTRLLDPTRLLVRHWLPVPQLPIVLADLAGADIVAVRFAYAALGAIGAALVGLYSFRTQGPRAGLVTLLLAASLPGFVIYSIVPYQEGPLVLFAFAFLCSWRSESREMSALARAAAATTLALACLCRYEAWILGVVFAIRPAVERRWRDLFVFAPAGIVMVGWLLVFPGLDVTNPMATPPPVDPTEVVPSALSLLLGTIWKIVEESHYVGLPLAIAGAGAAYRRGGLLGREMIAFWIAVVAVAMHRALGTLLTTERMTILPLIVATVYVPTGLEALRDLLESRAFARRWLGAAVTTGLVVSFVFITPDRLELRTRRYAHERSVALHLEGLSSELGEDARVGIVPRHSRNPWGESTLKAIFGQSMRLRADDPRWVLGGERVLAEQPSLDQIVYYDVKARRYQSVAPNRSPANARLSQALASPPRP